MIAHTASTVQSWVETRIEFLFEPAGFWRHPCPSLDVGGRADLVICLWSAPGEKDHPFVSELQAKESNLL